MANPIVDGKMKQIAEQFGLLVEFDRGQQAYVFRSREGGVVATAYAHEGRVGRVRHDCYGQSHKSGELNLHDQLTAEAFGSVV